MRERLRSALVRAPTSVLVLSHLAQLSRDREEDVINHALVCLLLLYMPSTNCSRVVLCLESGILDPVVTQSSLHPWLWPSFDSNHVPCYEIGDAMYGIVARRTQHISFDRIRNGHRAEWRLSPGRATCPHSIGIIHHFGHPRAELAWAMSCCHHRRPRTQLASEPVQGTLTDASLNSRHT